MLLSCELVGKFSFKISAAEPALRCIVYSRLGYYAGKIPVNRRDEYLESRHRYTGRLTRHFKARLSTSKLHDKDQSSIEDLLPLSSRPASLIFRAYKITPHCLSLFPRQMPDDYYFSSVATVQRILK